MAEEKKSDSSSEMHWAIAFLPLLILLGLAIIGARLEGQNIFGKQIVDPQTDIFASKRNLFDIYEWIGPGQIDYKTPVINVRNTTVRNQPAGSIVGAQKKLEIGVIREGPVNAFNVDWYLVDYENAPDGWVLAPMVTSKINTVRAVNIIPILYSLYKPIGYGLLFVLFILFAYFKLKLNAESKIAEKKLELVRESSRKDAPSLQEQISAKPDIQEIPGFQTEEIMPVTELEKQNRWQHIQTLIKSYNANDWRQAIIEADIILEEMLDKMGYDGVTIGDKLKNVERSDFITLDKAWSAHKVRNQIAHEGSDFKLSRDLAENTIKDFEAVFKEFYYI